MMKVPGLRNKDLDIVIKSAYDNVVEVDFALISMIRAVDRWYRDYYQDDHYLTGRNTHITYLIKFYDSIRFSDHDTIKEERNKYLEEIDLYNQMKRDD
jgi:hypothetical protein